MKPSHSSMEGEMTSRSRRFSSDDQSKRLTGHQFNREGSLYIERNRIFEEVWVELHGRKFVAYCKSRPELPASRANRSNEIFLQFEVSIPSAIKQDDAKLVECDSKLVKFGLSDLSKILRSSTFSCDTPYFFSIIVSPIDKPSVTYLSATIDENDRLEWVRTLKALGRLRNSMDHDSTWLVTQQDGSTVEENENRFTSDHPLFLRPQPIKRGSSRRVPPQAPPEDNTVEKSPNWHLNARKRVVSEVDDTLNPMYFDPPKGSNRSRTTSTDSTNARSRSASVELDGLKESGRPSTRSRTSSKAEPSLEELAGLDDNSDFEEDGRIGGLLGKIWPYKTFLGIKVETLVRFFKICLAFPFVIVVASLNLSQKYGWLRSVVGIRVMNILIYIAPIFYVKFLLANLEDSMMQRIVIGLYTLLYLFPVAYVCFYKVKVSTSASTIEEGTFCFKPAKAVRFTQANFYAVFGFVMEWMQHVLYVLPVGIVTSEKQTKISDFPPYLPFSVYFWTCIASTFICGVILILNSSLRGKLHYRFQGSYLIWFFLYNVGSPMFVTFMTFFFMSMCCDYDQHPPVLVQEPSIVCYSDEHITMARAGLVAFAVYLIQHTLLPSGTFKETMRDSDLDIVFVPVYLQGHYLLKAIFSGFYVYFYQDNWIRVVALTFINLMLLVLNNYIKPCSVGWINLLRDCFLLHATLSGIISLNYLAWPADVSTKGMVISTLSSTVLFSSIGAYMYYKYTRRSMEYTIAAAFLDLEWQVAHGGSVHPRVLEPLISLTLSPEERDWLIAKKYIGQLVWLISYPNMRVQFQSSWGLANLALLDEDARLKIHEAKGTQTLLEWYTEMDFVVQLETLAALANLSLSPVVAEDMVTRFKCIPFFIDLIKSNKAKHAQFSAIALANIARKENHRELIRKLGGIPALVGCIMSHNYHKRRHGCRALANMALSTSREVEQVFSSKGLMARIVKMATRKEIETQREVISLIRNLACHSRLRPLLLERDVMSAVESGQDSVFPEVREWCEEIRILLERELNGSSKGDEESGMEAIIRRENLRGRVDLQVEADVDLLLRMTPLEGRVEWSTWGSKLESIFDTVFSIIPTIQSSQVQLLMNTNVSVFLPVGVSKKDLLEWRDSLSYVILEKPVNGRLNEYATTSDELIYTPNPHYTGADFFTYRMMVGSVFSAPATIALQVIDPSNLEHETISNGGSSPKKSAIDLEMGSIRPKK